MTLRRRLALLACAAALTAPLAACGGEEHQTFADDEGAFVEVKDLAYQVQLSRELNPHDSEDHAYLDDVAPRFAQLAPDESWFGVFVQVRNDTGAPQPAAVDFRLTDTQNNVYTPIPISIKNPFAYHGGMVDAHGLLPRVPSVAYNIPALRGQLLLFKVKNFSFENRPLELTIKSPTIPQTAASVVLDL